MTIELLFTLLALAGVALSLLVMLLLRRQLRRVLLDVCGTESRADFWNAVSCVWIVLIGALAGTATLGYFTDNGGVDLFGGAATQVRYLLFGVLGAVLSVAVALIAAIHPQHRQPAPPPPPA